MWLNPKCSADFVTFAEKSLTENFTFCAVHGLSNNLEKLICFYKSVVIFKMQDKKDF